VAVDPNTGTVVDVLRFADWPIAAKLARWGIDTTWACCSEWSTRSCSPHWPSA
jgi:hypothetical protein